MVGSFEGVDEEAESLGKGRLSGASSGNPGTFIFWTRGNGDNDDGDDGYGDEMMLMMI